ncbi:MAG: hypothetical protein AAB926_00660 [Patescibacteria group bacterium]
MIVIALVGNLDGDIAEVPAFKEKFTFIGPGLNCRLFQRLVQSSKCFFQVSQSEVRVNPWNITLTCFGQEREQAEKEVDKFLEETGVEELECLDVLEELFRQAKLLVRQGARPVSEDAVIEAWLKVRGEGKETEEIIPTKPSKAKLPIVATKEPFPVGSIFPLPDGQRMKVVRQLTSKQVQEISLQFYQVMMDHLPPGAPVYWCESKPVRN